MGVIKDIILVIGLVLYVYSQYKLLCLLHMIIEKAREVKNEGG